MSLNGFTESADSGADKPLPPVEAGTSRVLVTALDIAVSLSAFISRGASGEDGDRAAKMSDSGEQTFGDRVSSTVHWLALCCDACG